MMMRDSGPISTTPGRAGSLAAAVGRGLLRRRRGGDPGDQRDADAALRRDGKLLRGQRLAVDGGRGLHQRAGGAGRRTARGPARRSCAVRVSLPTVQRHLLAGDVVAHPLAHDAHGDGPIGQLRRRQRRARDRATDRAS